MFSSTLVKQPHEQAVVSGPLLSQAIFYVIFLSHPSSDPCRPIFLFSLRFAAIDYRFWLSPGAVAAVMAKASGRLSRSTLPVARIHETQMTGPACRVSGRALLFGRLEYIHLMTC